MEPEIARLESLLVEYVQAYLKAAEISDEPEMKEQLRWTYGVLARLLGLRLSDRNEWPTGGWVDDIDDFRDFYSEESTRPGELVLQGLMSWGRTATGEQWIEPFSASIRLSSSGDRLLGYKIKCGDATRGLGKIRYGRRVRRWPQEWIFEFESPL